MDDKYQLWPYPQKLEIFGKTNIFQDIRIEGNTDFFQIIKTDLNAVAGIRITDVADAYVLKFQQARKFLKKGAYCLHSQEKITTIEAEDNTGLFYGFQTFLQIFMISKKEGEFPLFHIEDWPAYRSRCFMVDMGRSIFSLNLLKRIVRILARLKMNMLHLHLYDDELCGVRFEGLPFGKENPYALSLKDLRELVDYAANYHVEIVPEIGSWGHVGSLVYHRKDLYGGSTTHTAASFLIKQEMFTLIRKLTEQIVDIMPKKATIHFGIDEEAKWCIDPSMPRQFSPIDLVRSIYGILMEVGEKSGKDLTMRLWAWLWASDHGDQQVPEEIQHNVIIEPWSYWKSGIGKINESIKKYSGKGKMRWIMGAGQGLAEPRGAYHATRAWCQGAINSPNVDGVNITLWGWNDLAEKMITLFAGAYYAWNPLSSAPFTNTEDYEKFDASVFRIMYSWQSFFRDAFPDDINHDRGPLVCKGYYMWGGKHGEPVASTVSAAKGKLITKA